MDQSQSALCRELEAVWHREIPMSAAMGIHVTRFDGTRLEIAAPLAPNVNVHGTAFAGSLYAVAALCGWGTTYLALRQRALDAHIVIADARIEYHRPIAETIVAYCAADPTEHREAFDRLLRTGKTRLPLTCGIGRGETAAATFAGSYAVRLIRASANG